MTAAAEMVRLVPALELMARMPSEVVPVTSPVVVTSAERDDLWESVRKYQVKVIVPCGEDEEEDYIRKDSVLSKQVKFDKQTGGTDITVLSAASAKGLKSKGVVSRSDIVSDAIIAAAKKHKADLVVMASHGRKGIKRLLLGSETQQVLTHCHVPVLVLR